MSVFCTPLRTNSLVLWWMHIQFVPQLYRLHNGITCINITFAYNIKMTKLNGQYPRFLKYVWNWTIFKHQLRACIETKKKHRTNTWDEYNNVLNTCWWSFTTTNGTLVKFNFVLQHENKHCRESYMVWYEVEAVLPYTDGYTLQRLTIFRF